MNEDQSGLFYSLLHADSQEEVVLILKNRGWWDDEVVWRYYGDDPGNFSTGANQQESAEAALVEKVVNAIDACLMRRCLEAEIDPRSLTAPQSMRVAIAQFYEGRESSEIRDYHGDLAEWPDRKLREVARDITIALTGPRPNAGRPSVTITDLGEGQSPEELPETILSLRTGVKREIPFVQGKWNMGGTGALRFCGTHHLQLVLSRRVPTLASREGKSSRWGFTVVRRELSTGSSKVSAYTYLAPIGASAKPRHGDILTLPGRPLRVRPQGGQPYVIDADHGTVLKLYEYDTKYRPHFFRRRGLRYRLDLHLPQTALPVRLHECRIEGQPRSFETTLMGFESRARNSGSLKPDRPVTFTVAVRGARAFVRAYVFKDGAAQTYRGGAGVLFVVNGQSHFIWDSSFFIRRDVNMDYLRRDLLVVVDCTSFPNHLLEDAFMASRDRLADNEVTRALLEGLASELRTNPTLRSLAAERRLRARTPATSDDHALEQALRRVFEADPALSSLFQPGSLLTNPSAPIASRSIRKFVGVPHPTFFRFAGLPAGRKLERDSHIGQRTRVRFETDTANGYFERDRDRGSFSIIGIRGEHREAITEYGLNLNDGLCNVSFGLPAWVKEGDQLAVEFIVDDPLLMDRLTNRATLAIRGRQRQRPGGRGVHPEPPVGPPGKGPPSGTGIALPHVTEVFEPEWPLHDMDRYSAMRVKKAPTPTNGDPAQAEFDYFLNMDNAYLALLLRVRAVNVNQLRGSFRLGMTLAAIAALGYVKRQHDDSEGDTSHGLEPQEFVARTTDALAPTMIALVRHVDELAQEAAATSDDDLESLASSDVVDVDTAEQQSALWPVD